ncbi:fungal-specific transcription factor domain-containing protein [Xylariomycetidae sp. FL0641]|nr:fungal-specific transcription factor domain-containing protein [Xylariomycetidae sp. FL0641]
MERLARCEKLLKQYASDAIPPSADGTPESPNGAQRESDHPTPASSEASITHSPNEKILREGGNVRFVDNFLWTSFHQELDAIRNLVDEADSPESGASVTDAFTPEDLSDFSMGVGNTPAEWGDLLTDPVHVFRLWQLFLERVNPLTKVIHVPTVQPYVLDAGTDMSSVPLNYQALLFSIFNLAVISLSNDECSQLLGMSRDAAFNQFSTASKSALVRYQYLKNHDMVILQALVLYIASLEGRYDPHGLWILGGTMVRLAQKMGYHRDGEHFGLDAYETEMRRRIWWQVIAQDAKHTIGAGLNHSLMPPQWDTKVPQNLNDADIFPGSTEPVQAREGPTEMAFCHLIYEFMKFVHSSHPVFEAAFNVVRNKSQGPVTAPERQAVEKFKTLLDEFNGRMEDLERRYVDPKAGPAHIAATAVRPMFTDKMKGMFSPSHMQSGHGADDFATEDHLFKILVMGHEYNARIHEQMASNGFIWFVRFNMDLKFALLVSRLLEQPNSPLAERGWNAVTTTYACHGDELLDMSRKQSVALAQLTIKAWEAREQALARAGQSADPPEFISHLRTRAPSPRSSRLSVPSMTTPPDPLQNYQFPPDLNGMGQFMGASDAGNVGWDMWDSSVMFNMPATTQSHATIPFGGLDLDFMGNLQ